MSSNYLLNKYSYCLFILLSITFYKVITNQYEAKVFYFIESFIAIAYVFWLCTTGSYHFLAQVKVFRHNQTSLKMKKSNRIIIISNNDIDSVSFYPVIFMKGNRVTIKMKITIYTKEEFFFNIKIEKEGITLSKLYNINYFYLLTDHFWGLLIKKK